MPSHAPSLVAETAPERERDDAAIDQLYREHQAFVWRNARRLGCADESVDDAVQEVFLVAARRLHEVSPGSNVRGWLFAIVFRIAQRLKRGKARYRVRLQRYAETQAEAHVPSHEHVSDAAKQLRNLLLRLDDSQRVVVILIELEGMTLAEVAAVMSIPQGTVATRLRAARRQLKEMIERDQALRERQTP